MNFDPANTGCAFHFLDSGMFTLWRMSKEWAKRTGRSEWDYYDTCAFFDYMDDYAHFVKTYRVAIDYYSNCDVIPNPDLSWRNQQYLEECHKLSPVPVIHYTTPVSWIEFYIDRGYPYIALGGLVGSTKHRGSHDWLHRAFEIICDTPDRKPRVRTHGFGVTSYDLLLKFPWYSVDSSTWTKLGAYGAILVPHRRGGKFIFTEKPYKVEVSEDSPERKELGKHFMTYSKLEQRVILDWLDHIGIPMGHVNADGECTEVGVRTNHSCRKAANIFFYEEMRKALPDYPWPYRPKNRRRGFGLKFQERATK
jgi:hypothetical protein